MDDRCVYMMNTSVYSSYMSSDFFIRVLIMDVWSEIKKEALEMKYLEFQKGNMIFSGCMPLIGKRMSGK